ncbi:MAG: cytochrome c biogenesis protein CcdA [Afipia sp.]|nr:cytochrome c biogenesis protein CcdA [Afipia sp.]
MAFGIWGLAFVAGLLSILSPCVLPLLPIVFGTAASEHRRGPVALAMGVALSFTVIGLFVATVGFGIGLDADLFRKVAATLMIVVGVVLAMPVLQMRLGAVGGPLSNWADGKMSGVQSRGIAGQLLMGLLLGMVWSPCVGPTLGAASILAAQGTSLGQVSVTMLAFGIGAALPLIAIGLVSRQMMANWRSRMISAGKNAKTVLGNLLVLIGLLILSGLDKNLETILVNISPDWLTNLTTRY